MDAAASHPPRQPKRLLYVAAAGYGKTSALTAEAGPGDTCVSAADVLDRLGGTDEPASLFVDDLDRLTTTQQQTVVRDLGRLGQQVGFRLASRTPLDANVRALLPGQVFERGPADLALDLESVARVLRDEWGLEDVALATSVLDVTAGWPALVQYAADALSRGSSDDLLSMLSEPGTAAATWIENDVLGGLPDPARSLVDIAADLDLLSPTLSDQWSDDAGTPLGHACSWLRRTGVLVPHPQRARSADEVRLVPVVAAVVRARHSSTAGPVHPEALSTAASWYEAHGHPYLAASSLVRAGRPAAAVALVERRGEEMLGAGDAVGVADILREPAGRQDLGPDGQLLFADALRMSGDVPAALRAFAPEVEQAERTDSWRPALAWRLAMAHYLLADYRTALDVLDNVDVDLTTPDRDAAEMLACRANVLSMLGAEDDADSVARTAVRLATRLDDERAAAAAHLAAAKIATGAAKDDHLARALTAANRCGDAVLAARVLLNQTFSHLAAVRYHEAREVGERAVRAAERSGPPGVLAVSLDNLGEALHRLGQHEAALLHFERSIAVCRQAGLNRSGFGLLGIADVHRELGRREQSIIAYDAAVAAAREADEVQILVPALAGLARVRAQDADELTLARDAVEEAQRYSCPNFAAYVLIAAGRVAYAEGDRARAAQLAEEALAVARSTNVIDCLAEALELSALVSIEPRQAQQSLHQALDVWAAGGAQPSADRVRVLLGRLTGASRSVRLDARDAVRRLVRLGIDSVDGVPLGSPSGAVGVEVRLLGGFEVLVGGDVVPLPAWRSKQARTLVKILASRRGRVITRSELCELLWPDDEPSATGHRLSVLLSAVRGVLDPERTWPADHFIAADQSGLSLNLAHVLVDVEQLLQDSSHAADLLKEGDVDRARELLAEVVSSYGGEALEDEPYADWADGIREQARAAAWRSLRNLAVVRRRAGEHNEAAVLLVRLLAEDPFDEAAHRSLVQVLVGAGRHGEARRAFARWADAMRSIDAPAPDRGVLKPDPPLASRSRAVAVAAT